MKRLDRSKDYVEYKNLLDRYELLEKRYVELSEKRVKEYSENRTRKVVIQDLVKDKQILFDRYSETRNELCALKRCGKKMVNMLFDGDIPNELM